MLPSVVSSKIFQNMSFTVAHSDYVRLSVVTGRALLLDNKETCLSSGLMVFNIEETKQGGCKKMGVKVKREFRRFRGQEGSSKSVKQNCF